ncbi:MAG: carboxypeptidase regulatory-like domain-containing protein [Bryobacteraceae bacterium]|nr:carboxypeptidase regulatory-like domain-containing protein [Bryobacteraceae bacterium]
MSAQVMFLYLALSGLISVSMAAEVVVCLDSGTGQGISGATVTLSRQGTVAGEAETDPDGRAALPDLPPGIYMVHIEKPGYVDLQDPQSRGRQLRLPLPGATVHAYVSRTAVITGSISDSEGHPVSGARVVAIVRRGTASEAGLIEFGRAAHSDDQGIYRLHGLPPGHYSVAALPPRGDVSADPFMPTFYGPGSPAEAIFVQIMPGETRGSVDLTVARSWPISISGTIAGIPDGEGRREAAVALVAKRGLRAPIAYTLAGQEGAYTFANVPPGDYTVIAWWPFQGWESHVHAIGSDGRTAAVNVPVSSSNARIDLELRPVVQVEGQLVLDNANLSRSECRRIEPLTFRSDDAWFGDWTAVLSADGKRFTVSSLPVGAYQIHAAQLEGCHLAIRQGERAAHSGTVHVDASTSLTVVLSAATGELSGQVHVEDGAPRPTGFVLLVRADETGRLELTPIDGEGRYRFRDIQPGTYRLTAVERVDTAGIMDPLAVPPDSAMTITVEAGKSQTANMRMIRK